MVPSIHPGGTVRHAATLSLVLAAACVAAPRGDDSITRYPPGVTPGTPLADVKRALRYPVLLRDGRRLASVREPVVAFGKVRVQEEGDAATWLDGRGVDVEASRPGWSLAAVWDALDRHPWQGRGLPKVEIRTADGTTRAVPDGRTVLLWAWNTS
jgi:hypothetical protein